MSEGTNPFNETGTNLLPSTNLDFDEAPTSRALTLSSQGTNLVFRSSYSKDTNPSLLGLIENVNSAYLNVLDIFITVFFLPKIFTDFTVQCLHLSKTQNVSIVQILQILTCISLQLSSFQAFNVDYLLASTPPQLYY